MGGSHINTQILRARIADSRSGLDRRRRHPPDVARACAVERLSPAPMGYRRLSGALVRGLSGAQPLHGVRPLSAFRRGFRVLDQSRDPGAGDAVDPAADTARARHGPALAAAGDQPRADPDDRAAMACEHAADRHLCRAVGAVAFHPGRAWRADLDNRKMLAVRLDGLRRGVAQRDAGGAARTVLRRMDRASVSARTDCGRRT